MRIILSVVLALALLVSSGCVASEVEANRRFWSDVAGANKDTLVLLSTNQKQRLRGYHLVAAQVRGRPQEPEEIRLTANVVSSDLTLRNQLLGGRMSNLSMTAGETDGEKAGPVPPGLAELKLTKAYVAAVEDQGKKSETKTRFDYDDVQAFGREVLRMGTANEDAAKRPLGSLVRLYMTAYFQGKFVDRRGVKYEAPKDIEKGLSGDVLAALVAIGMEALSDFMFEVPCYKGSDGIYLNEGKEEPTAVKLKMQQGLTVQAETVPGSITELEARLMSLISTFAGKKSEAVSKLVVEAFKEVEVDFVLGGDFAIGDAEAFKKMVQSFFDVGSRRLTEYYVYEGLRQFEYTAAGGDDNNPHVITPANTDLAHKAVAIMLQEQELLKKWLK
jgi:hypothetical protein